MCPPCKQQCSSSDDMSLNTQVWFLSDVSCLRYQETTICLNFHLIFSHRDLDLGHGHSKYNRDLSVMECDHISKFGFHQMQDTYDSETNLLTPALPPTYQTSAKMIARCNLIKRYNIYFLLFIVSATLNNFSVIRPVFIGGRDSPVIM